MDKSDKRISMSLKPLPQSDWVSDKQVTKCENCSLPFTVTRRRHHCRACGHIFCSTCSRIRMKFADEAATDKEEIGRVCENCFFTLSKIDSAQKESINNICRELNDEAIFESFVFAANNIKKLASKDSEHILIIGNYRILLFQKDSMKLTVNIHLYDVKEVKASEKNKLEIVFTQGKSNTSIFIDSPMSNYIVKHIRESYRVISVGFPIDSQIKFDIDASNALPLNDFDGSKRFADGFIDSYLAYCNYLNASIHPPFMQFIVDLSDHSMRHLEFSDIPGIEKGELMMDMTPVTMALRYNGFFTSIGFSDIGRNKPISLITPFLSTNTALRSVKISNLTESNSSLVDIANALQTNVHNNVHTLEISDVKLSGIGKSKSFFTLVRALRSFKHGLKSLNFSGMGLQPSDLTTLINELLNGNFGVSLSIEELDLSHNKFNDNVSTLLGKWLTDAKSHSKLRRLRISNCGANLATFMQPLMSYPHLLELDVSGNRSSPYAVGFLASITEISTSLRILNISNLGLNAEQCLTIIKPLVTKSSIEKSEINLSDNNVFSNENELSQWQSLFRNPHFNVHTLNLSNNPIKEKNFIFLISWMTDAGDNFHVDTLYLNNMVKEKITTTKLANSLAQLVKTQISIKSLSLCGFHETALLPFLQQLSENETLLHLDVSGNNFGDIGASIVAAFLRMNKALLYLACDNNKITQQGFAAIASVFVHNSTLQYFDFPWIDFKACNQGNLSNPNKSALNFLIKIQSSVEVNRKLAKGKISRFEPVPKIVSTDPVPLAEVPEDLKKKEYVNSEILKNDENVELPIGEKNRRISFVSNSQPPAAENSTSSFKDSEPSKSDSEEKQNGKEEEEQESPKVEPKIQKTEPKANESPKVEPKVQETPKIVVQESPADEEKVESKEEENKVQEPAEVPAEPPNPPPPPPSTAPKKEKKEKKESEEKKPDMDDLLDSINLFDKGKLKKIQTDDRSSPLFSESNCEENELIHLGTGNKIRKNTSAAKKDGSVDAANIGEALFTALNQRRMTISNKADEEKD